MPQTNLKKARSNAKRIGVTIKPSTLKNKKLDVFTKKGDKISIGDIRYSDFLQHGDEKRKQNYKSRHTCRKKVGTACYFADQILWS